MNQLNVLILSGNWELWFLNNDRVFSDHRMDWMDLLEMIPEWGSFSWSYAMMENILPDGRRNTFSLRSSDMPKTFAELTQLLTVHEYDALLWELQRNRTMPKESTP